MRIIEELDIDNIVDVPDTPDRLSARRAIGRESVGRDRYSSLAENFRSRNILFENSVNGLRAKDKPSTQNGHSTRRPVIHPPKSFSNSRTTSFGDPNIVSSSESSFGSQNGRLFRRAAVDESSSLGARPDKGKSVSIDKAPTNHREDSDFLDLKKWQGFAGNSKTIHANGSLKHVIPEEKRKGQVASSGSSYGSRGLESSEMFRNSFVRNVKIGETTRKDRGETIVLSPDSQHRTGERVSPISLSSPRVAGRRSLVRNGCISPLNVAKAEQLKSSSKNIEQSHTANGVSNFVASPLDIMSEIIAEDSNSGRMKGKAKLTIPDSPNKQSENLLFATSSSRGSDSGEANRVMNAHRDAFGSQGFGGWRTTHNYSRKPENSVPNVAESNSRRINDVRNSSCQQHENRVETRESQQNHLMERNLSEGENDVRKATSVTGTGQSSGQTRAETTVTKRLKKQGTIPSGHGECSTSMSEDPDVLFLGTSRESMRSRSSRVQRPRSRATLGPVIEVDDFSPPVGRSAPQSEEYTNEDDSDVRAMQVEADEILARELQEQLYHETPIVGGGEIDEYLAWAMQQEGNGSSTSGVRQNTSHPRGSVISHVQRQPRRSTQTRSGRRGGIQSRAPSSSRMAQIRGRNPRQSHAVMRRARNLQFPLGMDLDMRLNILEALEAGIGDYGDVNVANPIYQVQRDFNENDYEMLLALDEQNHRHGGGSTNLINSLPQSVVQNDNQEDCAICLETPTVGDTVRHLPCFHKFHKDCIDPWLSLKTSCPVCKLSIT